MQKIDVAILGATGAVGQRFIQLLDNHPWFRVAEVIGSSRSGRQERYFYIVEEGVQRGYRDCISSVRPVIRSS